MLIGIRDVNVARVHKLPLIIALTVLVIRIVPEPTSKVQVVGIQLELLVV